MVLRNTGYEKISGDAAVPYGVVVMRSCSKAQDRLEDGISKQVKRRDL